MRLLTRTVRGWLLGSLGVGLTLGSLASAVGGQGGDAVLPGASAPVRLVSSVCGWSYFICWSVSFWPQVLLNHQRKTVDGLSVDFLVLNVVGFAAYAAYNVLLFFPTKIRESYVDSRGEPPGVHMNDVVFAVHALLLTVVSLGQAVVYTRDARDLRVLPATITFCGACTVGVMAAIRRGPFVLLDALSAVKLASSLSKFVPQILENRRTHSTIGFSFAQVVLDATGSVLSVSQLLLDAFVLHSLSIIRGNPAKLGLGAVSMLYDGMLTYQHIIYDEEDVDEPLL